MSKSRPASNRKFYTALALIGLVGASVLAYLAGRPRHTVRTIDPKDLPKAEGHLLGSASAPVEVIEFGDFECPSCGNFAVVTEPDIRKRLVETGQVRIRFFDFPLPMHKNTVPASMAAGCAGDQGKFWDMHDSLYLYQDQWNGLTTNNPKKVFKRFAGGMGLDVAKWEQCFDTDAKQPQIEATRLEGERRQIGSTPTFVIGKRMVPGAMTFDEFRAYVDSARAELRPAVDPAPTPIAPKSGGTPR